MFSDKLKYVRKRLQLTQAELAELMGVSVSTLVRWENSNKDPILKYQGKLSEICKERDIKLKELKPYKKNIAHFNLLIGIDIIRFIDANGVTQAKDIAAEFNMSTRTVYRYVRVFKHQGLVRTSRGKMGGIEVKD